MTHSSAVAAMARTTQSPVSSLWMTVWQARYLDGDAGLLPSPLRREVPRCIHQTSPRAPAVPRLSPRPSPCGLASRAERGWIARD